MNFPTDIEIAERTSIQPIRHIAEKLGITEEDLEYYGKHKAKIPLKYLDSERQKKAQLILVTAINPTPAGEGKTTVSVGLADGLQKIGKSSVAVLREPSLGPVFGIKGGAAGGGYAQVIPMVDINLHFTGDFNAVEKANNLLSALIDNELQNPKSALDLDPNKILWKRVMDMNDRSLRKIVIGLGGSTGGVVREEGFNITPASEIMAILCLAENFQDLKTRLGNILIGYSRTHQPVFVKDLKAQDAMAILLKDALQPNLVQTLEGTPAILHGGPFANIAQGTNTVIATKMGMSLADYVVTEAGFGADLGAEKFLDIKCRSAKIQPSAVVIVATARALRYHGGADKDSFGSPQLAVLKKGLENLGKHIENIQKFGLPVVVAINYFANDSAEEITAIQDYCKNKGVEAVLAEQFAKGGAGAEDLAAKVIETIEKNPNAALKFLYSEESTAEEKINSIAQEIYGADRVEISKEVRQKLKKLSDIGLGNLPICMAKTQKSLSDDETLRGRPTGFNIHINDLEVAAGAGFLVPISGNMMRMPGLPKMPAALSMTVDAEGKISGLS